MGLQVTVHMVASVDGFIARRDNSVSWLEDSGDVYEAGASVSAEEAAAFVRGIDCYVMGSRTYEHALELGWPYGETPVVVLTGRELRSERESVAFWSGDLRRLVEERLGRYRTLWVVGGAMVCQRFLALGLVDEIRLTVAPVLLGDGVRLFGEGGESRWRLKNVTAYRNGFVELVYAARGK